MPITNERVAGIFEEIADLLEIEEANPFRVRAYRNAARTVRGLGRDLGQMLAEDEDLTRLPGIGKDLAAKIEEIVATGRTAALDQLHKEVPSSLEALLKLPGLGPKRVKLLYQELDITTPKQLEQAARQGRLRQLPGFGPKTEQHMLESLAAHRGKKKRFLYKTARAYAESLVAHLKSAAGVADVVVAGSYRRGRDTVGDLDILVTARTNDPVTKRFLEHVEVGEVISSGPTRSTVLLKNGLQVDLRVVDQSSFGAALQYFTGSKAHNILIRRLGQQRGLKINEYGVFKKDRRIAGHTETSVYRAVGLPLIPPELREARGEIDVARAGKLPKLVRLEDLQGDLHLHTRATDGTASIEAMARAAVERGHGYIAITDHSQHLKMVHGLDERRLKQQIDEINRLNSKFGDLTILKGIEVDILEDGRLDLPDRILGELDLVIGAVHGYFHLSPRKQTDRILRAMDSKFFSILAHPVARLLGERDAIAMDVPRILRAAKERGCYAELNCQPERMDLTDTYCQLARDMGVLVCINSDSHSPDQLDYLRDGINQARRGWLEKGDVLNTRSLRQLRPLLKATMG